MKKRNNAMKYLQFAVILLLILALLGFRNEFIITGLLVAGIGGTLLIIAIPRLPRVSIRRILEKRAGKQKAGKEKKREPGFPESGKPDIHTALLCQVSHRITEKLKSAFPDAAWDWVERPDATALLDGKTVRIRTANTKGYSHAELTVDAYGNISLKMMVIKPIQEAGHKRKKPGPAPKTPDQEAETPDSEAEPPVVDCRSWFDLVGRQALTDIVVELNARGHSQLSINEQGDILIRENRKMVQKASLPHFPGKDYYRELVPILADAELKASVYNGNLKVSWV